MTHQFDQIEVSLNKEKNKQYSSNVVKNDENQKNEKKIGMNSNLLIELQEIKLLEQRQALTSKRNQRSFHYYS